MGLPSSPSDQEGREHPLLCGLSRLERQAQTARQPHPVDGRGTGPSILRKGVPDIPIPEHPRPRLRVLDATDQRSRQRNDGLRHPPTEVRIQLPTLRYPERTLLHGATHGRRPSGTRLGNVHALPGRCRDMEHWIRQRPRRTRVQLLRADDDATSSRVRATAMGRTLHEGQQVRPIRYQSRVLRTHRESRGATHGPQEDLGSQRHGPHEHKYGNQNKIVLGDVLILPPVHRRILENCHPAD